MAALITPRNTTEAYSDHLVRDFTEVKKGYYQDQFTRSQAAIEHAITGLSGTAIIMGSGACQDLPLEKIARQFHRVILLDIDARYTRQATEKLPTDLRERVEIIQADLTGYFEELKERVEAIKNKNPSFAIFRSEVVKMLPSLTKKESPCKGLKASFVCSSLVSSQLTGGLSTYIQSVSQGGYNQDFIPNKKQISSYENWLVQCQLDHLRELSSLVEPEGRVYFADHFSVKQVVQVTSKIGTDEIDLEKSSPILGAEKIQKYLSELFSKESEETWTWSLPLQIVPAQATVTHDDGTVEQIPATATHLRQYEITSLSLKKI